jgi:hypothetical protein
MPGPAPAHHPRFPEAFLQHARDTVGRRTAPHGLVQRARLALLLAHSPHLPHPEAIRQRPRRSNTTGSPSLPPARFPNRAMVLSFNDPIRS